MPGDVIFHAKKNGDSAYFGNVWHVSFCMEAGGGKVAHSLYGGAAVRTYSIDSADSADWMFFARPDYSVDYTVEENEPVPPVEPPQPIELKILEHPQDYTGAAGETAVFAVVAQGEGLTYQWQYQNANASQWYNSGFDGATTATQPVGVAAYRNGQKYRCVVTDKYGNSVISDAATLYCTE